MKRIFLSACVLILFFAVGCEKKSSSGVTDIMYLPFTARAYVKIAGSEYSLLVEKGGANLVSVTVEAPQSLCGMKLSLDETETLTFDEMNLSEGFAKSIAHLFYYAFNEHSRLGIIHHERMAVVSFSAFGKEGEISVDTFSGRPVSLRFSEIFVEFCDFIG